jgi:predicted DCC family thiol-disulfide oxidoreductase YuxK
MGLVVFSDSLLKKMMEKIDKVLFDEETGVYDLWVIRALITGHDRMDQVQVAVSNEGGRQNEIYDKDFILSLANYLLEKSQERLAKKAALEEIVRLLNVSPARM